MSATATLTVPFSTIPRKPVRWLHTGFIPFRHVTVVVGQGGTSKGLCTLDYAARMTRGDPMPGEPETGSKVPMDVILIAPEDDPNEAVAGRLSGAGAITDRVHNLTIFPDGHPFSVPADIPSISAAIAEIEDPELTPLPHDGKPRKVGMVIADPLLALAQNDLRTRGQARPVMEALEAVAKAHHLVILLTHHTNANGQAASSRAIVETSRNVITLSRVPRSPDNDPRRILTVTKTNIGLVGASLRYELTGTIETPKVIWACELPPDEASRGYDVEQQAKPAKQAACRHPWKAGSCSDCPLRNAGRHAASASVPERKPRSPFMGIPLAQRYRASFSRGEGKPQVIGDYSTLELAQKACQQHCGNQIGKWWAQPGMQGAVVSDSATGVSTYYGAIDRYAKAAADPDKKAA